MATDTYNIYRIALYIVNIIGWTAVTVPAIYLTSHFVFLRQCVDGALAKWICWPTLDYRAFNGTTSDVSVL